jgi:hexosaminidase
MRYLFFFLFSFHTITMEIHAQNIIPRPNSLSVSGLVTDLKQGATIYAPSDPSYQIVAKHLADGLAAQGIKATLIKTVKGEPGTPHFVLMTNLDPTATDESYRIKVRDQGLVQVASKRASGAFYAVQTILQSIDNQQLPGLDVEDAPRFGYRGMHLDVARHFYPVSFVKQYIDLLARYKMNAFHWHLTDDQGWRIEIKKYPKLQEISAWRSETLIGHYSDQPHQFDGKRYGGYYTQDQIREVVAYAKERFVTVIPEIEMPGHAVAALSAYPELSCTGELPERYPNVAANAKRLTDISGAAPIWGVFDDVFCTKEATFTFMQNVLTEVVDLFPSTLIHIGGDECPKTRWKTCPTCQKNIKDNGLKDEHELQSWFIKRIEVFLAKKGRKLIGWDEILEGGLAPGATVMSWRGVEGGIQAAKAGHDVVMTPTSHCYLDYYQSGAATEPLAIGGLLPLEKVYQYEPIPTSLTAEQAKHILGVQGNVWSEYMPNTNAALYMALPRMQAIAEVGWTQPDLKNLVHFAERLNHHTKIWKKQGIHHANKLNDTKSCITAGDGRGVRLTFSTLAGLAPIKYRINDGPEIAYSDSILLTEAAKIKAYADADSQSVSIQFDPHAACGAKVHLRNMPALKYSGGGKGSPFNGVNGSDERYGDDEWLGFSGKDFYAEIELVQPAFITSIDLRFYHAPGQWIYAPTRVEVYDLSSFNGEEILLGTVAVKATDSKVQTIHLPMMPTMTYKLRIRAINFGKIPDGEQGAGNPAWLFVDEVRVK